MFTYIRTVKEVTSHIRHLFDQDALLQDVWVSGEVSNMTRASSGHWYFTLKDSEAQLRCVMWRSAAQRHPTVPKDGDRLEVHGSITLYEPRGEYQLYADALHFAGVGDLYQEFERLKARLQAEGLFDAERKRPTPPFPRRIGVVTSPTAAAFQDIQNVLARRYPLAEVLLSPTMVQGTEAPPLIVRALQRLNQRDDVDVILLCRGGGSIEDLWAFNDERVAYAVAKSRIPVITGVGHETDFTIVDFVSDQRAPTPSAAAELATPDLFELRLDLNALEARLLVTLEDQLAGLRSDVQVQRRALERTSPVNVIRTSRQRLDDFTGRMSQQQKSRFTLLRERLQSRTAALEAASPQAILARGYAIVTRTDDGQRVKAEDDAAPGTGLTIQLQAGELKARVEDKESHGRYTRTLF
ncbi:MAG: exodeoxyribonuclease VII large subunit [Anaerolineae bacterium]